MYKAWLSGRRARRKLRERVQRLEERVAALEALKRRKSSPEAIAAWNRGLEKAREAKRLKAAKKQAEETVDYCRACEVGEPCQRHPFLPFIEPHTHAPDKS